MTTQTSATLCPLPKLNVRFTFIHASVHGTDGFDAVDGPIAKAKLRRSTSAPALTQSTTSVVASTIKAPCSANDGAPVPKHDSVDRLWCQSYSINKPGNCGSFGHPFLCGAACRSFLASGRCSEGSTCDHCHLPHASIRLDKRQRSFLTRISEKALTKLVVTTLLERLRNMQMEPVASPLMEALQGLEKAWPLVETRQTRNLLKYMRTMTLSQLTSVLEHAGHVATAASLQSSFRQLRAHCDRESRSAWKWSASDCD